MILDEIYHYRNRSTVFWGVAFLAAGVVVVLVVVTMLIKTAIGQEENPLVILIPFCLFFTVIGSLLAFVGKRFLFAYWHFKELRIRITEQGVQIGDELSDWNIIPWIGGKQMLPFVGKLNLCIGVPEATNVGYEVPLDRRLSRSEFDELMNRIGLQLCDKFPSVDVGRIVGSGFRLLSPLPP